MEFTTSSRPQKTTTRKWSQITRAGLVSVLVGLLLLAASLLLTESGDPRAEHAATPLLLHLLGEVGLAFIVLGIFNLILSRGDWEEYFEDRLRTIVIDQGYLAGLEQSVLKRMMMNVIKAQAPGASVDRPGSFLEYFDRHLHQYIFDPYRENATLEVIFEEDSEDESSFLVTHKISYTMRAVGSTIQNEVKFWLEPEEFRGSATASVELRLPIGHPESGTAVQLLKNQVLAQAASGRYGLCAEIKSPYVDMDGLAVVVDTTYRVPKDGLQDWRMSAPTRNLSLILKFPDTFDVQVRTFVQTPPAEEWTRRPGYVTYRYPSWFLPSNGIAWKFVARPPVALRANEIRRITADAS